MKRLDETSPFHRFTNPQREKSVLFDGHELHTFTINMIILYMAVKSPIIIVKYMNIIRLTLYITRHLI